MYALPRTSTNPVRQSARAVSDDGYIELSPLTFPSAELYPSLLL